jgi:hypothetical protein
LDLPGETTFVIFEYAEAVPTLFVARILTRSRDPTSLALTRYLALPFRPSVTRANVRQDRRRSPQRCQE